MSDRGVGSATCRMLGSRGVAGLAMALAIIAVILQIGVMVEAQAAPPGTDAAAYIVAATRLRHGQNPYDQTLQMEVLPGGVFPRLPYLYPPLLAVLCIPLTYFPLQASVHLFVVLAVLEAALLAWALSRWIHWPAALAMVFLYIQTWFTVYFGQIGFVIALLQFAALWGIQNRRNGLMGMALALGALLKITPGVGLLMLSQRRHRNALPGVIAAVLLALAVTLPYAGLDRWLQGGLMSLRVQWNVSWLASWTGMLTLHLPSPYGWGLSLILGTTALAYTMMRLAKLPPVLGLSALLLLPLMFARTTWPHHTVTALPVLAVLWQRSPGNRLLSISAWLLMAVFDYQGVPPAITLCWVACVWPGSVRYLDVAALRLQSWWTRLQAGRSPA